MGSSILVCQPTLLSYLKLHLYQSIGESYTQVVHVHIVVQKIQTPIDVIVDHNVMNITSCSRLILAS